MDNYEKKCKETIANLTETSKELQDNKVTMIGFEEVQKEREIKINTLKKELAETKLAKDTIDTAHSTLKIKWDKICEQHESLQVNYDDVCEKLHVVTKRRYELETKVNDEIARNEKVREQLQIKEDTITRREAECEQLEKDKIERDRELENMAIKREGAEKQNAL